MKNLLKMLSLITAILICFNCGGDAGAPHIFSPDDENPVDDNGDNTDINDDEDNPVVITPPDENNNPGDENMAIDAIARFFYDGTVVNVNKDYTLNGYKQCNSYAVTDDFKHEIIDGTIFCNNKEVFQTGLNAKKIQYINDIYYITDEKGCVYEITEKGNKFLASSKIIGVDAFVCEYGYSDGNYFYFFDGTQTEFGTTLKLNDAIVQFKTLSANYSDVYFLEKGIFNKKAKVYNFNFAKVDFVEYKGLFYGLRGVVIDPKNADNNLIPEPIQTKRIDGNRVINWAYYRKGNAYLKYMNDPYRYEFFGVGMVGMDYRYFIGKKDNICYVFNSRNGNLSKFNFDGNEPAEYANLYKMTCSENCDINLVNGVPVPYPNHSDGFEWSKNSEIKNRTNPVMIDNFIYYFTGEKIERINIGTNAKDEIITAKYFKAWVKK